MGYSSVAVRSVITRIEAQGFVVKGNCPPVRSTRVIDVPATDEVATSLGRDGSPCENPGERLQAAPSEREPAPLPRTNLRFEESDELPPLMI